MINRITSLGFIYEITRNFNSFGFKRWLNLILTLSLTSSIGNIMCIYVHVHLNGGSKPTNFAYGLFLSKYLNCQVCQ